MPLTTMRSPDGVLVPVRQVGARQAGASPGLQYPSLSQGLLAYYSLDEGQGTTVVDRTGNGNTGTVNGTLPGFWTPTGKIAGAGVFNGTNNYVGIVQNKGLPIYRTTGYTIALWAKGNSAGTYIYAESNTGAVAGQILFGFLVSSNAVQVQLRSQAGVNIVLKTTVANALSGTVWHHIGWTDLNGTAAFYVDGVLDSTNYNYTPAALGSTLNTSAIGGISRSTLAVPFGGLIDEVFLSGRVLTPLEMSQLYNNGQGYRPV